MRKPQVLYTRNAIFVAVPYNFSFVEEIKQKVDKACRIWEPMFKVWIVNSKHREDIEDLIEKHFPNAEVMELNEEVTLTGLGLNSNYEITRIITKEGETIYFEPNKAKIPKNIKREVEKILEEKEF